MVATLRETDRWLRRVAVYMPIVTFIIGFGTGVITSALFIREIARDVTTLQQTTREHSDAVRLLNDRQQRMIAIIEDKFKTRIP